VPPLPLPLLLRNILHPLPPHRPEDWQVVVRRDAPDLTLEQMVLWNANVLHVPAGGGTARPTYAIQANDVVFHLPAGTGVHVRYHSPFSYGTAEQTLHRRPLDVLLTVGEEQQILADMETREKISRIHDGASCHCTYRPSPSPPLLPLSS
jgi:hypothetical protein